MRLILVSMVLILGAIKVSGQGNDKPSSGVTSLPEKRWDLDRYVWSHTHAGTLPAGKRLLDFDAIDNWQGVNPGRLGLCVSPDGQYMGYAIVRSSGSQNKKIDSVVVQATDGSWREVLTGGALGFFSANSKWYIYEDKGGLCFLSTGTGERRYVNGVASYKLPQPSTGLGGQSNNKNEWLVIALKEPKGSLLVENLVSGEEKRIEQVSSYDFDKSGRWLVCGPGGESKELLLYRLADGMEKRFTQVTDYAISANGHVLLLEQATKATKEEHTQVQCIDLEAGETKTIWDGNNGSVKVSSFAFDGLGRQAVLLVGTGDSVDNSLWYWQVGMERADEKIKARSADVATELQLQGPVSFTPDGKYIQLLFQQPVQEQKAPKGSVPMDVWSYRDSILQSVQPGELKKPILYKAVYNLGSNQLLQLEKGYEKSYVIGDYALVTERGQDVYHDRFWKEGYNKDTHWLVSLKDGSRRLLPTRSHKIEMRFSPDGHYLVYYDAARAGNYYSYDVQSGREVNISKGIPAWQLGGDVDPYLRTGDKPAYSIGIAGWLGDKGEVLVYDAYDIWQLDFTGKRPPVNLTNGYGRKHQVLFSLLEGDRAWVGGNIYTPLTMGDRIVLRAFNRLTKWSGYYSKQLGKAGDPERLFMGPYYFKHLVGEWWGEDEMSPLKAKEANKWIVLRQSASDAPNYFETSDFKHYRQLSYLAPQKGYNWLTATLCRFKQPDGTMSQGVLYKPENFDASKKYPVIISFYAGGLSGLLYTYPRPNYIEMPDLSQNPAWMVSHGYLVFVPDIYFIKDQWGPSVLNSVEGAVNYLRSLSYVDGKRIGSSSHSNGGRFGYYVFTHTSKLAAMAIGSGTTDMIAITLKLESSGSSSLAWGEQWSYGTGLGELWLNKARWIDHMAVLQADKAKSPLLLFHNKNDGAFNAGSAISMYISLRRLEKPCWWLQYDYGDHIVVGNNARDYTLRYTQYFDHYLKGAPAPIWMTHGIAYGMRGIETGFELDTDGSCGLHCPVCKSRDK